jgi:hypothetical protein
MYSVLRVYLPRMAIGFSTICDRDELETRRRKRKGIQRACVLVPLDDEHERSRRRVRGRRQSMTNALED